MLLFSRKQYYKFKFEIDHLLFIHIKMNSKNLNAFSQASR